MPGDTLVKPVLPAWTATEPADRADRISQQQWKGTSLQDSMFDPAGNSVPIVQSGSMWPMACVRLSSMHHNAAVVREVCQAHGVQLAPHMKASMSPEVAALQTHGSPWALSVASAAQLMAVRSWGAGRVLLANETSDPTLLSWLRAELVRDPGFECYFYVDSAAGAALAGKYLAEAPSAYTLIECGYPGGRAGARRYNQVAEVAYVARDCGLRVVGVAGYEGMLAEDRSDRSIRRVRSFGLLLRRWLGQLDEDGLLDSACEEFVISCGGSMFFDVLARELGAPWALARPVVPVLRAGSFILHDHGHYAGAGRLGRDLGLRPALEIWAQVLSRPESDLVILGAGRRDIGSDLGLPVVVRSVAPAAPLHRAEAEVFDMHDQHLLVKVPPTHRVNVGDVVVLGVSHPSITMDKWSALAVLDDDDRIIGRISTYY